MEELTHKQKDAVVRKLLREVPLEEPNRDFTANVMSGIYKEALQKTTVYKPPISLRSWLLIASLFCLAAGFSVFIKPETGQQWLEFPEWDLWPSLSFLNKMGSLGFSKSLSYGLLAIAVAVLAQLYFLKGHLDKRMPITKY